MFTESMFRIDNSLNFSRKVNTIEIRPGFAVDSWKRSLGWWAVFSFS